MNPDFLYYQLPIFAMKLYFPDLSPEEMLGYRTVKWQVRNDRYGWIIKTVMKTIFILSCPIQAWSIWMIPLALTFHFSLKISENDNLRILPSPLIKEIIFANLTIGANGYTSLPDKSFFYVWEAFVLRGTSVIICSLFNVQCIQHINVINI